MIMLELKEKLDNSIALAGVMHLGGMHGMQKLTAGMMIIKYIVRFT